MSVDLKLSRSNRIYRPTDFLEGKIITKFTSPISHHAIRITVNGSVNLQVRGGSAGIIESLYGVVKPINIVNKSVEIKSSGKIGSGTTEIEAIASKLIAALIPFSIVLRQPGEKNVKRFYETYHGANISIQYLVTVDIMRGYLHKSLSATVEFIIEGDRVDTFESWSSPEMVSFYITHDTQKHPLLPQLKSGGFRVTGRMSTQRSLSDPISGELTVEASAVPIQSIDIHLLRVESILTGERIAAETSLIQTTQIADGDVCRKMTIPIYVILPRLLTCSTILAGPFSIEFKVSITITFKSDLSKLQPKSSDPRTPRLGLQWKLYHLIWSVQGDESQCHLAERAKNVFLLYSVKEVVQPLEACPNKGSTF